MPVFLRRNRPISCLCPTAGPSLYPSSSTRQIYRKSGRNYTGKRANYLRDYHVFISRRGNNPRRRWLTRKYQRRASTKKKKNKKKKNNTPPPSKQARLKIYLTPFIKVRKKKQHTNKRRPSSIQAGEFIIFKSTRTQTHRQTKMPRFAVVWWRRHLWVRRPLCGRCLSRAAMPLFIQFFLPEAEASAETRGKSRPPKTVRVYLRE